MGHIAAVSDRSSGAETVPSAVPATEVLSAQVSELDTSSSACSRLAFAKMTGLWRTRLGIPHILALSQPCVREIRARLARKLCGGSRGATCASQTESWRCRGMATCPCGMCGKYFCINCVQTYEETDGSLTHLCGPCVDAIMNDSQDRRDAVAAAGQNGSIRDLQARVDELARNPRRARGTQDADSGELTPAASRRTTAISDADLHGTIGAINEVLRVRGSHHYILRGRSQPPNSLPTRR